MKNYLSEPFRTRINSIVSYRVRANNNNNDNTDIKKTKEDADWMVECVDRLFHYFEQSVPANKWKKK